MDEFKPAWWLKGRHLQTLWPNFFRRKYKLQTNNERLELPDGDFLDLVWVGSESGPLVVLLHGLNGGINSHYINGMLHTISKNGWRGVLMHFRGCSSEPNRLARSYHAGETSDLFTFINTVIKREPNTPIFIVGYSLGANVLLKALGTLEMPANIKAACAVSVPFELDGTANYMSQGLKSWYQKHLVNGLVRQHKRKFSNHPDYLKLVNAKKLTNFWDFDNLITAPLHGFKNAHEYYKESSSRQYLKNITIPTLIIHAINDPFTNPNSIPQEDEFSNKVSLHLTNDGGHVGFVSSKCLWQPNYWLESQIMRYFLAQIS